MQSGLDLTPTICWPCVLPITNEISFFQLQNTNQTRVVGRRGGVGQSRRRFAARQTRLSGIRVAWNSASKYNVLGKGRWHVVTRCHTLHDACRKVSWNDFLFDCLMVRPRKPNKTTPNIFHLLLVPLPGSRNNDWGQLERNKCEEWIYCYWLRLRRANGKSHEILFKEGLQLLPISFNELLPLFVAKLFLLQSRAIVQRRRVCSPSPPNPSQSSLSSWEEQIFEYVLKPFRVVEIFK